MLTIIHHASDALLAAQIKETVRDLEDYAGMIVVLSPAGVGDVRVMRAIYDAVDRSQHILPVLAKPVVLPDVIANLQPLVMSEGLRTDALRERITALQSGGLTMQTLTPRKRMHNRNFGLLIGFIVVFMFVIGIVSIAVLGIRPPREEYNTLDTMVAATQHIYIAPEIAPFVPRSTDDALSFPATAQAMPTRFRPYLIMTATAVAPGD
jgi:hypothetical protein